MTGPVTQPASMHGSPLDALAAWADEVENYRLAPPEALTDLRAQLEHARRGRLDQPPPPTLTVLLLGASGAGKSQLLNALAGERIAASHHVRPTTKRPTVYIHADLPVARLYDYGPLLGDLAKEPGALRTHRRDELRHKILIDAPDIDSYETGHRDLVLDLLPAVDVALYVVTPYNYKDDVGWQVVMDERGRRAFAFVINKWDPEGKPKVVPGTRDVDDDLRELLEGAGWEQPRLFRTSARYWLERRAGAERPEPAPGADMDEFPASELPARGRPKLSAVPSPADAPAPAGDQFPELERWLAAGLSTNQVQQIQRRRRRSLWGGLAGAAAAAVPPAAAAEGPWPASARAALVALAREGPEILAPALQARARELAASVDAGDRPDTPGPYGMACRAATAIGSGVKQVFRARPLALLPSPLPVPISGDGSKSAGSSASGVAATLPSPDPAHASVVVPESRLDDFLARRLASLEWQARETRLPVDWISARWTAAVPRVRGAVADSLDAAGAELSRSNRSPARRKAALAAAWTVEAISTGVVLMAAWRLFTGFLVARYLDMTFLANFAAILFCVFLLGQAAVGMALPGGERALRRALQARTAKAWADAVTPLQDDLADYESAARRLRAEGQALGRRFGDETQRLTDELAAAASAAAADEDQTENLFADFEHDPAANGG